jgi:hypothetical protein
MSFADYAQSQPILAVALIVALVVLVILLGAYEFGGRKYASGRYWRPKVYGGIRTLPKAGIGEKYRTPTYDGLGRHTSVDVGEQLNAVMSAPFERRRVMNRSEYRAFKIIEGELAAIRRGFRLFAQTSLGEILSSPSDSAFHAINAKRVDMLIIDHCGLPTLAIEYQGEHHYQGNAAARDAIKKEALRKAGVKYLEISAEFSEDQIRSRLREQLG